jgi:PDZ domain-containing secreted protein
MQFGVKYNGVKYDAVLKRVKETSPFVNQLRCGDRLVALNGRRVCDTGRCGLFFMCGR